jgi:hypothetical protein
MQAQYAFAGSDSNSSNNDAMIEMRGHNANLEAVRARTSKHLPRPPHKTIEPGKWQQLDHLVDQTIWETYYKSFVTS